MPLRVPHTPTTGGRDHPVPSRSVGAPSRSVRVGHPGPDEPASAARDDPKRPPPEVLPQTLGGQSGGMGTADQHKGIEPTDAADEVDRSRRKLLLAGGVGASALWVAPAVVQVSSARAATSPPNSTTTTSSTSSSSTSSPSTSTSSTSTSSTSSSSSSTSSSSTSSSSTSVLPDDTTPGSSTTLGNGGTVPGGKTTTSAAPQRGPTVGGDRVTRGPLARTGAEILTWAAAGGAATATGVAVKRAADRRQAVAEEDGSGLPAADTSDD